MSTVPEAVGRRPAAPAAPHPHVHAADPAIVGRIERAWQLVRWPLAVFAATRLMYLLLAVLDSRLRGWDVGWEVSNWDGIWYLLLVHTGYPTQVMHTQSTLGFLPLYPMLIYAVQETFRVSSVLSGMVVATVSGAAATVLISVLAGRWWGAQASRRVVLFLCLFPGSIVFSMLYTEGLLIALVAGCLLALEQRRWLLAGALAGLSTAVGPVAVAVIPACAVAAWLELRPRRHPLATPAGGRGFALAGAPTPRRDWSALLAPALAPLGIVAFGIFLWFWTGNPLASYIAQHDAWQESSTPLALVWTAGHFLHQIIFIPNLHNPGINLNYPVGLLGAGFLAAGLWWLWRERPRIPMPALVWTLGVAVLTVTSANVPPNPRMLICAFPVVAIWAVRMRGRAFNWLCVTAAGLNVAMTLVTFVGTGLRP